LLRSKSRGKFFQLPFLISRGRNSDFLCKFSLRKGLPSLAHEKIAAIQLYLASDRLLERLISEAHQKARRSISGTPLQSRDWLKKEFDAPRNWFQKPRKRGTLFEIVFRALNCKSLDNLHFYVPTVEVKRSRNEI